MIWTPELKEQLRALWADGVSTIQMGMRLGVSKNAVVGTVHRMKLTQRGDYIYPERTPEKLALIDEMLRNGMSVHGIAKKTHSSPDFIRQRRNELGLPTWRKTSSRGRFNFGHVGDLFDDPDFEAQPSRVLPRFTVVPVRTYAPRKTTACCWPIGEPRAKDFRFCDDTSEPGRTYCVAHCHDAYQNYQRAA